jgi:hypothetical protein
MHTDMHDGGLKNPSTEVPLLLLLLSGHSFSFFVSSLIVFLEEV